VSLAALVFAFVLLLVLAYVTPRRRESTSTDAGESAQLEGSTL
jgi:hypothetical protein